MRPKKSKPKTLLALIFFSLVARGHINATQARLKLYSLAVSSSAFCENPTVVYRNDNPTAVDFFAAPVLVSARIPEGTYRCVIAEISDQVVIVPDHTEGSCTGGTDVLTDICGPDQKFDFRLVDGTVGHCAPGEQKVAVYLSTASLQTFFSETVNGFLPPTQEKDLQRGLSLEKPITISAQGQTNSIFGVDPRGRINEELKTCFFEFPSFYWR